ncbi:O-methyltransferase [Streptomyces mashuensis]|uniref:O-methyltransferase n=1 Tax=Streptomyces mashuensis TaxID=33904 RepID=A0A919EC58_9ACTN|nr:methyltransferase [Streptomyces mashuensis]GHF47208.1 O-methyltransferase [Streptomyces mashuensis]
MTTSAPKDVAAQLLMEQALGHLHTAALRSAAELRIADHLGAGPRTPEELAGTIGADATVLRRVLRLLASRGIFREDEAGAFHVTPAARMLRTDEPGSLRTAVLMMTDGMFVRAATELTETVRTGEPGFPRVHGRTLWEHLETDPAARALFHSGMAAYSDPVNDAVAAAYPFPAKGTVVDVGGGRGGLLGSALRHHPGLTGVLLDQAAAVREPLLVGDPAVAGRWQAVAGDFLTSVPDGADVYVVKQVLPDWDDENAVRILGACRRAMAPGGRVLVVDAVLGPDNAPHPGKAVDVMMMTLGGGRHRDLAELDALFAAAGLRRTRVVPTGAPASVVEAEAGVSHSS